MADEQVTSWLKCAGLARFSSRFAAASVSASQFLQLSPTDIDALGLHGPADKKRLADLIAALRRTSSVSLPSSSRRSTISRDEKVRRPFAHSASMITPKKKTRVDAERSLSAGEEEADAHKENTKGLATNTEVARSRPKVNRPRVTVCVRKRPLSRKESSSSNRDIITVEHSDASLLVHELKEKVDLTKYVDTHKFSFDHVFGEQVDNISVYEAAAKPLVNTFFAGGRATCFAYGQTGAGKTYTMEGSGLENPGLYTLAVTDVFDRLRQMEQAQWQADANGEYTGQDALQVWISFYEIYASKLKDLLNHSGLLDCWEDANQEVRIVGLTEIECTDEEEVLSYIEQGSRIRATGVTGANDDSSRSHAVFQIALRRPVTTKIDQTAQLVKRLVNDGNVEEERGVEVGRLCFIDLAGSERGGDTSRSSRQTRMEGSEINKSLLALKECIRAMDQRKDHTPFRGSKLTQVLKSSLMGKKCATVMIANVSPSSSNVEHTLNTLRYSDRVKELGKGGKEKRSMGKRNQTFTDGIGLRSTRRVTRSATERRITSEKSQIATETKERETVDISNLRISANTAEERGNESEKIAARPRPRARRSDASMSFGGAENGLGRLRPPRKSGVSAARLPRASLDVSGLPRARSRTGRVDRLDMTGESMGRTSSVSRIGGAKKVKKKEKAEWESSDSSSSSRGSAKVYDMEVELSDEDLLFTGADDVMKRDNDSALKNVMKVHHMQIEELMRLTEADVGLVNAVEKGDIDREEYALKLGLNLSQKLEVVRTLQSKLKLLQ